MRYKAKFNVSMFHCEILLKIRVPNKNKRRMRSIIHLRLESYIYINIRVNIKKDREN